MGENGEIHPCYVRFADGIFVHCESLNKHAIPHARGKEDRMITKGTAFDRRSFLKGAMLAGAGTAAFGLAGCAANGGGASGGASSNASASSGTAGHLSA